MFNFQDIFKYEDNYGRDNASFVSIFEEDCRLSRTQCIIAEERSLIFDHDSDGYLCCPAITKHKISVSRQSGSAEVHSKIKYNYTPEIIFFFIQIGSSE